jgi:hypothetical protein
MTSYKSNLLNTVDYVESSTSSSGPDPSLQLHYGCSAWVLSSQYASDAYDAGHELWRKEQLADIETQLARSFEIEYFAVQRVDNVIIHIKNPMYQIQHPIW